MLDVTLPLRATQALFAIVSLGLDGYLCHWYRAHSLYRYAPSQVNFLLFCAVWTLLLAPLLFLAPRRFPRFANKWVILGLDALTMLFWFAGFIALAVFHHNLQLCWGHICDVMVAGIVFGALEWLLFLATTILAALHVMRTRGTSNTAAKEVEMSPPGTTAV